MKIVWYIEKYVVSLYQQKGKIITQELMTKNYYYYGKFEF